MASEGGTDRDVRQYRDAGIHAASEWVLRRWGKDAQLKEKDRELATGKLEGNIRAKHVVVSGQFGGSITCERLEIVSEGRVIGEVETAQLVIEAGGQFSGASRIKDEEPRQIPFRPENDEDDSGFEVVNN